MLKSSCMKPKPFITGRLLLLFSAIALTLVLVSWNFKQSPGRFHQNRPVNDTTPKEKNKDGEKKIRDLDDVLNELDAAELKVNMEQVQKEIAKAMKEIEKVDMGKIKMEMDKAMKEVDMEKIKSEVDKAIKEVDMEKIKREVEESVSKIDWDKMKAELEEVKNMNMEKVQDQMKEVEKQMEKIGPQIRKEMEKAKGQIEKAKTEMNEYKEFIDGLDKDGLINKKEDYTIQHKDGVLTVNGKKVSVGVYSKYRSFLENHKTFTIEKNNDDFNIHTDKHRD